MIINVINVVIGWKDGRSSGLDFPLFVGVIVMWGRDEVGDTCHSSALYCIASQSESCLLLVRFIRSILAKLF